MSTPHVAVGLCDGVAGRPELVRLQAQLAALVPAVRVEVLPDLCRRPELLPELAERTGARRIVLGLCEGVSSGAELQAWIRKAGLDPFALELLAPLEPLGEAPVRLAAAVARLEAFGGSQPEQLRLKLLSLEGKVSRRALFTLPPVTYEAVPSIDEEGCLGSRRCGLCIPACPVTAIEVHEGRVAVDRDGCATCGICVSTCPVDAIGFPGAALAQYEAELNVLAASGQAVALTCRRDRATGERLGAGWARVPVPCLGMVTPGWLLQALAAGAPAVALLACADGCGVGQEPAVESRADYTTELLRLLGDEEATRRVVLGAQAAASPPAVTRLSQPAGQLQLREPAATITAALVLAQHAGDSGVFLHASSPLGLVSVRDDTCTLCGACADVCPTGALTHTETAEAAVLAFDAAQCIACSRCVPVCPEGASETIRMSRATDLAAAAGGRMELKRDRVALCQNFGRPVAPRAMLERIRRTLETEEQTEPLLRLLTELCSDCRGLAT